MSDLISIGRSGVLAYQSALATVGENVTNANNPGYAKRSVVLKEQSAGSGPQYLSTDIAGFNGVQNATVSRAFDQFRAATAWSADADSSYASTRSQYLTTIQGELNDTDTGIGSKLTAIFGAGTALAANPGDDTLRQSMLYAIGDATGAIGQASADIDKVSATIGQQATAQVAALNTALQQLAGVNINLKTAPPGSSGRASLEDQRDTLIGTISGVIGVDATIGVDGTATLKLNNYNGTVLVSPASRTSATVNLTQAADGTLAVALQSADGSAHATTPTSGSLAGFIDAASNAADRKRDLDKLATDLMSKLNGWNNGGKLADGVTSGGDLLAGTDAQTIGLVANLKPDAIAAGDGTSANGNLITPLANLRQPDGIEAAWHGIVTGQALIVSAATTAATTASAQKDNAFSALDDVSGVNLDNEAADLLRFQQAYSASSKIIQAAKDTFQTILGLF